jgi:hypothetical protein
MRNSKALEGRGLQLPFEGSKFSKLHCDLRRAAVIIIAPDYLLYDYNNDKYLK